MEAKPQRGDMLIEKGSIKIMPHEFILGERQVEYRCVLTHRKTDRGQTPAG